MWHSRSRPASRSTSPTPTLPGSEAPTRTPTDCCANTFQRAPTSRAGMPKSSMPSQPHSTVDPARVSPGELPPKRLMSTYYPSNQPVLLRLIEPSQYTSRDFAELARANGVVLSVGRKGECWDNARSRIVFRHHQARAHRHTFMANDGPDFDAGSSSTSRVGTTPAGCTRRSATSVPLNTNLSTTTPTFRRRNQHEQRVRQTGSSPIQPRL